MPRKRTGAKLEKQLKIDSAAAVGALALAPAAEAAIHYSGIQNLPVNSSTSQTIDFDGNGPQFLIFYSHTLAYYEMGIRDVGTSAQHIKGDTVNQVVYYNYDALNLPANYAIGPVLANAPRAVWHASTNFDTLNGAANGSIGTEGNFNNATGYIGVRFLTSCGLTYGWIHYSGVTTIGEGVDLSGTIIDWAYEDSCQPIAAGQTPPAAIPTLNEWGMIIFTLIAGGLAARKLKKQEN